MKMGWGIGLAALLLSWSAVRAAQVAPTPERALVRASSTKALPALSARNLNIGIGGFPRRGASETGSSEEQGSSGGSVSEGAAVGKISDIEALLLEIFTAVMDGNLEQMGKLFTGEILDDVGRMRLTIDGIEINLMEAAILADKPESINALACPPIRLPLTPLNYVDAIVCGKMRVVMWWLDADLDRGDMGDGSAFLTAVAYGHEDLAKLFFERDHGVLNSKSSDSGSTALHLAVQGGHESLVKQLVSWGADLYANDNEYWQPIERARSCILLGKEGSDLHHRHIQILEFLTGKMGSCCACQ